MAMSTNGNAPKDGQLQSDEDEKKIETESNNNLNGYHREEADVDYTLQGFPSFKGPTSMIFTAYSAGDLGKKWRECGILIPHETLRFGNQLMRHAILSINSDSSSSNLQLQLQWKLLTFKRWWLEWYWPCLEDHHDGEELVYFPTIKARIKQMPERLSADHKTLISKGESIIKLLNKMGDNDNAANCDYSDILKELQQMLKEFIHLLEEHIMEEEKLVPQMLIEAKLTKKENDDLVSQIIRNSGMKINSLFLPAIVYCCHSWMGKDVALFLKEIPGPIQYFLNNKWFPKWRKYFLGNMVAIINDNQDDVETDDDSGCCNCCTLL